MKLVISLMLMTLISQGAQGAATTLRTMQTVPASALDQAAQACLREAAGFSDPALQADKAGFGHAALQLTRLSSLADVTLPAGEAQVQARPIGSGRGSVRAVALTISCDGRIARRLTVNYRARLEVEAPVATRALRAGETLTPACWTLQRHDIAALTAGPLPPSKLEGRRVRRAVRAGALLTADNTEPIPLVSKGGLVRVTFRAGAITLTCEGIARADAAAGQITVITNPSSGQTFEAVVTGPGQAEMALQEVSR